jgi:hypothetical protein
MRGSIQLASRINHFLLAILVCLASLASLVTLTFAAPILGQNQQEQIAAPKSTPVVPPTEVSARAAVIHFSILPSPANPDRFETTIFVQQDGGQRICVNHTSPEIVVRSYQTNADPFTPDIPSRIEGQESGDVGALAGFNSKNVFIRPGERSDRFDLPDEPFSVGQFEGVFRPDEIECDQELSAGEFVCLDEVIRNYGCELSQHADLVRELRIMLALNSIPLIAPAAGAPLNGLAGDSSGSQGGLAQSTGSTGAAPGFSGSFGGAGGGGLILVPDVVGLPFANAASVIASSGLVVGNVTQTSNSSASLFQGWIIGTAHAQSGPNNGTVKSQVPPGGASVLPGSAVSLALEFNSVTGDVPEPSSLIIFILGLIFIVSLYWWSRRQTAQKLPHA